MLVGNLIYAYTVIVVLVYSEVCEIVKVEVKSWLTDFYTLYNICFCSKLISYKLRS